MNELSSIVVALIVAGPTWLGLRRAAKKNDRDHERGRGMLGELLGLVGELRAWQLDHGHAHERSAAEWRAFVAANPQLVVPVLEEPPPAAPITTVDREAVTS